MYLACEENTDDVDKSGGGEDGVQVRLAKDENDMFSINCRHVQQETETGGCNRFGDLTEAPPLPSSALQLVDRSKRGGVFAWKLARGPLPPKTRVALVTQGVIVRSLR